MQTTIPSSPSHLCRGFVGFNFRLRTSLSFFLTKEEPGTGELPKPLHFTHSGVLIQMMSRWQK